MEGKGKKGFLVGIGVLWVGKWREEGWVEKEVARVGLEILWGDECRILHLLCRWQKLFMISLKNKI